MQSVMMAVSKRLDCNDLNECCMLQASYDMIQAAWKGQLEEVTMLLLNGADPTARERSYVSCSSCISIVSIDTAYTASEIFIVIGTLGCTTCHVHASSLTW